MEFVSAGDIEKYAYCPLSWWLSQQIDRVDDREGPKSQEAVAEELEKIHGEPYALVMTSEKYTMVNRITGKVTTIHKPKGTSWLSKFEYISTHPIWGILIMILIVGASFLLIFTLGDFITSIFDD